MQQTPKKVFPTLAFLFFALSLFVRFVIARISDENGLFYIAVHFGVMNFLILGILLMLIQRKFWLWWIISIFISLTIWLDPIIGFPISPPKEPKNEIRLLTYNIAHCDIDEAGVFDTLSRSNADFIFLQEASIHKDIDKLEQQIKLKMPGYSVVRSSFNMIVSRHPIELVNEINTQTKWPLKSFPEAVSTINGKEIRLISVHLEPSWLTADKEVLKGIRYLGTVAENRRAQFKLLIDRIKLSPEPIIIAGDLNGAAHTQIPRSISAILTDVQAQTGSGFNNTLLAAVPYQRIDYFFVSPSIVPVNCRPLNVNFSDHKPLVATVNL